MVDGVVDRRRAKQVGIALVLLVVVLPLAVYAVPQVVGAEHSYVVLSSSMSPAIGAGDVVIVDDVSPQRIGEGDVITFRGGGEGAGPGRVTHRVVEVVEQDGERRFRTKGDANEEADRELVAPDDVIGRVTFSIPLLGHLVSFAGSDAGIVALVIVPSVLLILNEGWRLYRGLAGSTAEGEDPE